MRSHVSLPSQCVPKKGVAPGPGAVRKIEWQPLAKKWLQGRNIILHTDSAKSYRATVPGVLHDRVIHKKQRIKVGTKFRWIGIIKAKSGTQIIDRCWRF